MKGNDFKKIRESLGDTQKQFALRLRVSLRSVQNWENAENLPRNAELLLKSVVNAHEGVSYSQESANKILEFATKHSRFHNLPPGFPDYDYWERMSGDSMSPLIYNGSYVACKFLENKDHILFGEIFHIMTMSYSVIRYIHPHPEREDWVILVAHNETLSKMPIPKEEVVRISIIRAILNIR